MDFKDYASKVNDFADYVKDNNLELYKQRGSSGHGYVFLLPKKELVDGKRIISEDEKPLLASILPQRFCKDTIEQSIRKEWGFGFFKKTEPELVELIDEAFAYIDELYRTISVYSLENDGNSDEFPLNPSGLEKLLDGEAVLFHYDHFHMH